MTKTARSPRASARVIPLRRATTLEMVRLACPDSPQALRISESFGLAILDSDGIRDLHERLIVETADALKEGLSDRAMEIHLQRIVGSYVGSAHGAGQFYSRAVTEAREATAKLANDMRDEDLGRSGRLRQPVAAQARVRGRHGPAGTRAPHGGRGRRCRLRAGHRRGLEAFRAAGRTRR